MKRLFASAASVTLLIGVSLACASTSSAPVTVTKAESAVSDCQKVGDVAVEPRTAESQILGELAEAAQKKGGNTVLVSADGARSGVAYRCQMPHSASR